MVDSVVLKGADANGEKDRREENDEENQRLDHSALDSQEYGDKGYEQLTERD